MNNENKECCPKFNPEKWDKKNHVWDNKLFIKETIPTIFHIPLPYMIGKSVGKMCKLVEDAKVAPINSEDALLLFRDPSAFKSEIYLTTTSTVIGAENVNISGNFISRVFAGPYNTVPKFIKEMSEYLTAEGKVAVDYYIHYAYCPKCAKRYGNNYMIIFAKI
ncbi:MAG: hydrolase [Patescibacteria group bacterium]